MSRQAQSVHWDSYQDTKVHREKLHRKMQKVETLRALVEAWESQPNCDYEYLRTLKARLRSAVAQLEAMSL